MLDAARTTHDVLNQAAPLAPYNVFEADQPLREALEREGGAWGVDRLRDTGELAGSLEAIEHSERCERNEPILRTHDRYGRRIDEVELDPSWHWLLRQADRARDPLAALARPAARRARGSRRAHVRLEPGERRRHVPGVHDLLGDPGAARGARPRRGVGAAPHQAELRGRRPGRDGDDREAGRLGRAGQHHGGRARRRRDLGDHRATSGSAPIPRATSS